jgi:hypothetical protein
MPNGFIFNKDAPEELAAEPDYKDGLEGQAEAAADAAKAFAPVGEVEHVLKSGYVSRPGDYKRGIKTRVVGNKVYVIGTDFKSHWIEFGSVNNPISAPLRRGVTAVGLKFDQANK